MDLRQAQGEGGGLGLSHREGPLRGPCSCLGLCVWPWHFSTSAQETADGCPQQSHSVLMDREVHLCRGSDWTLRLEPAQAWVSPSEVQSNVTLSHKEGKRCGTNPNPLQGGA